MFSGAHLLKQRRFIVAFFLAASWVVFSNVALYSFWTSNSIHDILDSPREDDLQERTAARSGLSRDHKKYLCIL